uniref:C2H2-type domain-containing protein n=1 Tax=Ciona savignyi TaxID=51511 RepID=H2Z713_CIOSA
MSRRKQSNPQHVHTNDLDTKKGDTKTSPGHTMEIVKEDISGDQNRQSVSRPSTHELSRRTSSTESTHSLAESESPVSNTVHAERKYECSSCGVSFLQKSTLEVHKENYCTGQRYKMECKVCGAKFSDNDMFEMHMEVHMWKFTCHICQTHYETQEAYDRHFAAHVTKPNGSCSICEYKSRSPDDMTKHLKVHRNYLELSSTDERLPQPPKPKSPSAVKREEAHTSKELGNGRLGECRKASPISEQNSPRKFKCIVCSDSFGEVDSLQQHLLTAHASVQPTKPAPNLKETPQHPFRRHSIAVNR